MNNSDYINSCNINDKKYLNNLQLISTMKDKSLVKTMMLGMVDC